MTRGLQISVMALVMILAVGASNSFSYLRYNIGGILLNRALARDEQGSSSIELAHRMFESALNEHQSARGYLRLGQSSLLMRQFHRAEIELATSISYGVADERSYLWLVESLTEQGETEDAILQLLELLEHNPFQLEAFDQLDTLYSGLGVDLTDKETRTNTKYLEVAPGQSLQVNVSLPAVRPRWLLLCYYSESGIEARVLADGELIGGIHSTGESWHMQRLRLPEPADDNVSVMVVNRSASIGFTVSQIRLEYIANVEIFSDVTNATWTDQPHKAIGPGGRYETLLYAPVLVSSVVVVNFYDYPDRYLNVQIDGMEVGQLAGGTQRPGGRGWTSFSFRVPEVSGDLLRVTLSNPSRTQATALRFVYVVEQEGQ